MKVLFAVALLVMLAACSTPGDVHNPTAHRPLPYAPPPPPLPDQGRDCASDLRVCPGGRLVGRDPARDCAFDACPGAGDNK